MPMNRSKHLRTATSIANVAGEMPGSPSARCTYSVSRGAVRQQQPSAATAAAEHLEGKKQKEELIRRQKVRTSVVFPRLAGDVLGKQRTRQAGQRVA